MKRLELIRRTRALTRDFSNSIFREQDIIDFINEGVSRFKQSIPELSSLEGLLIQDAVPDPIPEHYQHLLAVYSASRCFGQDERYYQATTLMNEFEVKLDELKQSIYSGAITLTDPITGKKIDSTSSEEYVNIESYFGKEHMEGW